MTNTDYPLAYRHSRRGPLRVRGHAQGDYYTDLETYLHTERRFPALFEGATGYRPPSSLGVPVPAYEGVAALGGELLFPAGTSR